MLATRDRHPRGADQRQTVDIVYFGPDLSNRGRGAIG